MVADSAAVALSWSDQLGGGVGARAAIALGISASTLGSLNGSIMTGGRTFFSTARNGTMIGCCRVLGVLNSKQSPEVLSYQLVPGPRTRR